MREFTMRKHEKRSIFKNSILVFLLQVLLTFIVLALGLSFTTWSTDQGQHPKLNRVKIINQHQNALTSYIKLGNFHFVNNRDYAEPNNYSLHYNQTFNPYRHLNFAGGNQRMNFKPYARLKNLDSEHNPQSIAITNHGTLYVTHRVDNRGEIQIIRYHITEKRHHLQFTNYAAGPVFKGGHGQSLAYNPKTHKLWMLTNEEGASFMTSIQEIGKKSLNPIKQINFIMYPYPMGDVLTFDKHGNAYTCTRTFNPRGGANMDSLKLYKGKISHNQVQFHMVQGIRNAPGLIMQNMGYDPKHNRIYFVTDGELMSAPTKYFNHLRPNDIKATKLTGHYEFEDIAFYHGHGYLLLHYPSELLIN